MSCSPYNTRNRPIHLSEVAACLRGAKIQRRPRDVELYRRAFVHTSYCSRATEEPPAGCLPLQSESYERMEFLGDAIVGSCVAHYLYSRYPDANEGTLTKLRAKLVNGAMLASLARRHGFDRYLILSHQQEKRHGRTAQKQMGDTFEAFVGAIFLDFDRRPVKNLGVPPLFQGVGYQVASAWVIGTMEACVDFSELWNDIDGSKETLARAMAAHFGEAPVYESSEDGRSVVVRRGDEVLGAGTGATRREARANAAAAALNQMS